MALTLLILWQSFLVLYGCLELVSIVCSIGTSRIAVHTHIYSPAFLTSFPRLHVYYMRGRTPLHTVTYAVIRKWNNMSILHLHWTLHWAKSQFFLPPSVLAHFHSVSFTSAFRSIAILMVSAWPIISNPDSEVHSYTLKRCASVLHDASTQRASLRWSNLRTLQTQHPKRL
jgi:hypothetical protein